MDGGIDIACVGLGCYDLYFEVDHHPSPDEKVFSRSFFAAGGGPAANAAVAISRLGYRSAFVGKLSNDIFGRHQIEEFISEGVDIRFVDKKECSPAIAAVIVKPDGSRAVISQKSVESDDQPLLNLETLNPGVLLFDGHQLDMSQALLDRKCPKILDAGSIHQGTLALMTKVDHLVCSEKFAREWSGDADPEKALDLLSERSPSVVITLGANGLLWRKGAERGRLTGFEVACVDSTGAGDAFHGAFAAGLFAGLAWEDLLHFASAVGALCCTQVGARKGLPTREEVVSFIRRSGCAFSLPERDFSNH